MTTFLAGHSESSFSELEFVLIEAENEDAALEVYVQKCVITDSIFLEHVAGRAVNDGVCEHFWMREGDEQEKFNATGEILIDDDEFKVRVREFFGKHTDFAQRYLDFYFSPDPDDFDQYGISATDLETVQSFPEEMLLYFVNNLDWTEITVVQFADIPRL